MNQRTERILVVDLWLSEPQDLQTKFERLEGAWQQERTVKQGRLRSCPREPLRQHQRLQPVFLAVTPSQPAA